MNAHAISSSSKSAAHDCGCGCGGRCGCESRCCELECLVRPNYFCGQLLTDVDLRAMVDWARRRLSLSRYRDGWGIACGLQVNCSALPGARACCDDTGKGPFVYVKPGYAVDCCGNDLVVCEPIKVDLSGACHPDDDPCAKPKVEAKPADNYRSDENCWDRIGKNPFAVDLFLRYEEDLSHGQRAIFGGNCGQDPGCEYARVVERPCVHAEAVTDLKIEKGGMPERNEEFRKNLIETMKAVRAALDKGARGVREYLRRHPPARLCFLSELVCCLFDDEAAKIERSDENKGRVVLWLLYDWYLQQLECDCWSCKPDEGVPLARVYLGRSDVPDGGCHVIFIDHSPSHRRMLSKDDCLIVPDGWLDLRRFHGQPLESAQAALDRYDINIIKDVSAKEALDKIMPKSVLFMAPGKRVQGYAFDDPSGLRRVLGFYEGS